MAQVAMSWLVIAMGLLAAVAGTALATQELRAARRRYDRTTPLSTAALESWSAWFLGGFSLLAAGTRGLVMIAAAVLWALAGLWCIGLGIRLFSHG